MGKNTREGTFIRIQLRDAEARQACIKILHTAAENAIKNEVGVLKYCYARNVDAEDRNLYLIEEYANEAAHKLHFEEGPVKDAFAWISGAGQANGAPAALVSNIFEPVDGAECFRRPEVAQKRDITLIVTETLYQADSADQIRAAEAVKTGRDDKSSTFVYGVWAKHEPATSTSKVYVVAACDADPQVETQLVHKAVQNCGALRLGTLTATTVWKLKVVGGYLYK